MAGLEMRFSRSSPFGTRRAAPRTQESHPSTLDGLGAHNLIFSTSGAICTFRWMPPPGWQPPYERPEHGHHARAERVGRDWVGLSST